jgi:hypothetical protein
VKFPGIDISVRVRILLLVCFIASCPVFAGDIREFDIKTIERLGAELTRVIQTSEM